MLENDAFHNLGKMILSWTIPKCEENIKIFSDMHKIFEKLLEDLR